MLWHAMSMCSFSERAMTVRMTLRKPGHSATFFLVLCLGGCGDFVDELEQTPASALPQVTETPRTDGGIALEKLTINGLVFDVRTAGPSDGDVVFLLHGFPQTSYEWRKQIPVLAAAGYRVIAPDLRGISPGARPPAVLDYNIVNYLDDLLKMAAHYNAPRFHLVGHDVGGMVAWGMGMVLPEKLKSLTVLSDPHPAAWAKQLSDPNSCQRKASWWYEEVLKDDRAAQEEKLWPLLLETWSGMEPDAQAEYKRLLGTPDAIQAALNIFRASFSNGLEVPAALPLPVTAPTVYIWGDRDVNNCGDGEPMTRELCPVSYRYEELKGVSHWIPEEAPDQLNAILLDHLGSHR
jgi:pimeloyl-ACP methyl ester carboxylesterase